jgi:hypothetical protein
LRSPAISTAAPAPGSRLHAPHQRHSGRDSNLVTFLTTPWRINRSPKSAPRRALPAHNPWSEGPRGVRTSSHNLHRCCRKYNVLSETFSLVRTSISLAIPYRGISRRLNPVMAVRGSMRCTRADKRMSTFPAEQCPTHHCLGQLVEYPVMLRCPPRLPAVQTGSPS